MANYELIFDMGSAYIAAGLKKDGFSDKYLSQLLEIPFRRGVRRTG